jgi:response regulator RpfG family c-di-GMP phosphodiesterase
MNNSKNLLFVDDEKEILEILVDLFSDEGYNLHTATRAADALQIVNECTVDFVLSDLKLPDSSGSELLRRIQEKCPHAIRVLTSGYLDIKFGRVAVDDHDGTFYLSKPWDLLILKQLVEEKVG